MCIRDSPVTSGTQTLKDAVNETLREWTLRVHDTHYVLGSVMEMCIRDSAATNDQAVFYR